MLHHSPSIDILGSYFPAWMVCITLGLLLMLITRQILTGLRLNGHLRPAALVYLCMTILFAMVVWLALYQN